MEDEELGLNTFMKRDEQYLSVTIIDVITRE